MTLTIDTPKRLDRLYIGGQWVEAEAGQEDLIDPSTEEVFGQGPVGGPGNAEAAIAAARKAADEGPWPRMTPKDRSRLLEAFHAHLEARTDELTELARIETGAPISFARTAHILGPLKYLAFCAEFAQRDLTRAQPPTVTPGPTGAKILGSSVTLRDPAGVVCAITAFNFPFLLNIQKLGPALAMGNTVVLKPSPFTPISSLVLGEAAEAAGFPPGVLNVVTGGIEIGTAVTTDPRIDVISFTGSDAVGAAISAQAAPTIKRVLLELGGKSALIVRPDADLEAATDTGVFSNINQSGQGCILWTRHLVHNSVKAEYVALLTKKLSEVKQGATSDPATRMGPLIRASQRARVENFVEKGKQEGATLVLGGGRPAHLDRGYFFEPTVFDNVDNRSTIAQNEIFGPVTAVIGFDTDDEAVRIANDTDFGLSGHIYSKDVGTAYEMATRLRTGQVWLNGGNGTTNPWDPFGGVKRSGIGREGGEEAFLEMTETKVIRYRAG